MHRESQLKAQNFIEIALLAAVIVVITISVATIYNNSKTKTAGLSQIKVTHGQRDGSSLNLKDASEADLSKKIPFSNSNVDTAGALSVGMSVADLSAAMSNLTYSQLKQAIDSNSGQDLLTLANKLGANLDAENVNEATLTSLVDTLNGIPETGRTADQQAFVDRFKELLNISQNAQRDSNGNAI